MTRHELVDEWMDAIVYTNKQIEFNDHTHKKNKLTSFNHEDDDDSLDAIQIVNWNWICSLAFSVGPRTNFRRLWSPFAAVSWSLVETVRRQTHSFSSDWLNARALELLVFSVCTLIHSLGLVPLVTPWALYPLCDNGHQSARPGQLACSAGRRANWIESEQINMHSLLSAPTNRPPLSPYHLFRDDPTLNGSTQFNLWRWFVFGSRVIPNSRIFSTSIGLLLVGRKSWSWFDSIPKVILFFSSSKIWFIEQVRRDLSKRSVTSCCFDERPPFWTFPSQTFWPSSSSYSIILNVHGQTKRTRPTDRLDQSPLLTHFTFTETHTHTHTTIRNVSALSRLDPVRAAVVVVMVTNLLIHSSA